MFWTLIEVIFFLISFNFVHILSVVFMFIFDFESQRRLWIEDWMPAKTNYINFVCLIYNRKHPAVSFS